MFLANVVLCIMTTSLSDIQCLVCAVIHSQMTMDLVCLPRKRKPRLKMRCTFHPFRRFRRQRELKKIYYKKLAHVFQSSSCAWAFPNCNDPRLMIGSVPEGYDSYPDSIVDDPRALILDLNGLLIHKVDLEDQMFFPSWHVEYDQVLVEKPRRFYFLVRPDAREFLLWASMHFSVFIWSSCSERNLVMRFRECFPGLRGFMAGFIGQDSCDILKGHWLHGKKPVFFKHLDDFWSKFGDKFGAHNTLLVDDSLYKCFFNPSGTCCIVPKFGSPHDRRLKPFLTHRLCPWLWNYLKAEDRYEFVGTGDVFGTWGSEEDAMVRTLIEQHGWRCLNCCCGVRLGRIVQKSSIEKEKEKDDKVGDSQEEKEAFKVVWMSQPLFKRPGQSRLGTLM